MTEPTPFVVHCGQCQHEWTAAYLPMDLETFGKVAAKAVCPFGCSEELVLCGKAPRPEPEERDDNAELVRFWKGVSE